MTKRYEWPQITVVHPEHGSYQMHVHLLRSPVGELVLAAFSHGVNSRRQVEIVRNIARDLGDTIEPLTEDDISEDMAIRLAAQFHARPNLQVAILPVTRPL